MADNEQIREQNAINRATGQGHDAARRETAGMVEKLREVLSRYGGHKSGCDFYRGGDCQEDCDCGWSQARTALVETEWVSAQHGQDQYRQIPGEALAESKPQQQPLWSDAPDAGPPVGSVQTDADTLKPTVTIPLQLSPLEIARRIVAPWTVYGNVRIDGKVIECAIIAVIEEERKAASEAKLSVVRYAGKRIARLEAEVQGFIREAAVATRNGVAAQTRIEELEDDLKLQRQANKFGDDQHKQEVEELKRQVANFTAGAKNMGAALTDAMNHEEELEQQLEAARDSIRNCGSGAIKHSDALGAVLEVHFKLAFPNHLSPAGVIRWLGSQLSPARCGVKDHRQADVVPERRKEERRVDQLPSATGAMRRQQRQRRITNSGPPCGRCEEVNRACAEAEIAEAERQGERVEQARHEALEEAKERLDALCKGAGGHPSLQEIYTAIRGEK